jgi:hypothetical protein
MDITCHHLEVLIYHLLFCLDFCILGSCWKTPLTDTEAAQEGVSRTHRMRGESISWWAVWSSASLAAAQQTTKKDGSNINRKA